MVMLIKYTLTKVNNEIGAKSSLCRKACSYVGMLGARRPRARGGAERAGGVAHPAGTAGRLAYLPNSFRKIAH